MAPRNDGPHVEIEIKLEARADAELPDLRGLPGVAATAVESTDDLDATYFDTADLRLVRAGITLRRRAGGADEGWHLKLPEQAAPRGQTEPSGQTEQTGHRLEVHRPLGTQPRVVPAQLLALVRARLLGEPLAPVARIRTTRARLALFSPEGARLAEVADDAVTAEVYIPAPEHLVIPEIPETLEISEDPEPPEIAEHGADPAVLHCWREFEVELDEGDPTLLEHARTMLLQNAARPAVAPSKLVRALGDRLRAEGPEPEPKAKGAARPVVERLRELAEQLVRLDPRVRLGIEGAAPELRRVVREIDGLLVVFAPLFEAEPTEALRRELSRLGAALERLHEVGSVLDELLSLLAAEPAEVVVGPVRERIDADLGQELRQARIELVQELNAPGHLALLRRLGAFALTPPTVAITLDPEQKKRKAVLTVLTPLVSAVHSTIMIGDDESPAALEQVCAAAEVLLPVGGRRVGDYLEAARAAEAARAGLGHHTRVRRRLLALAQRATRVGENAFTYGHLYAVLGEPSAGPAAGELLTRLAEAAHHWPRVEQANG